MLKLLLAAVGKVPPAARQISECCATEDGISSSGSASLLDLLYGALQLADDLGSVTGSTCAVVAVYLDQSISYILCTFAALLLGAAFLPLSAKWPNKRLAAVLDQARPSAILWAPELQFGGCGRLPVAHEGCPAVDVQRYLAFCMPKENCAAEMQKILAAIDSATTRNFCYMMSTSGSSGSPKLVRGTEAGLVNRIQWFEDKHPWQEGDVACFKTSPAFVDSIWEMFGPLVHGVPLVILEEAVVKNPRRLAVALECHKISHLVAVPTLLEMALPQLEGCAKQLKLRMLLSSGEALARSLLTRIRLALPGCCVLNLYGSTEAAGDSTCFDTSSLEMKEFNGSVPVGLPLPNTAVFIVRNSGSDVDPSGELDLAPLGVAGEICIAGVGLAAAPDSTLQLKSIQKVPSRLLCNRSGSALLGEGFKSLGAEGEPLLLLFTGDVGRVTEQGLEILGRADLVVKLAGAKVDLSEVESVLEDHPSIHSAAAKVWHLQSGLQLLMGYVILGQPCKLGDPEEAVLKQDLTEFCRAHLQPQAVPGELQVLSSLPRSAAGKVDRSALPSPAEASAEKAGWSRQPGWEAWLLSAFRLALNQPRLEPAANLWEAGASSVTAAVIANQAGVDLRLLIRYPSARLLARHLEGGKGTELAGEPEAKQRTKKRKRSVAEIGPLPVCQENPTEGAAGNILLPELGGIVLTSCGRTLIYEPPQLPVSSSVSAFWHRYLEDNAAFGDLRSENRSSPRCCWRVKLKECVDASPTVIVQPEFSRSPSLGGDVADPVTSAKARWWAFACSHGGDVICVDGLSGDVSWRIDLPERADAGLAVTADMQALAVASGTEIIFLSTADGAQLGRFDTGGAIGAAPCVDPWDSCVWVTSHSGRVSVLDPSCGDPLLWHHDVGSPMSTPAIFAEEEKVVFLTTLAGTVQALRPAESGKSLYNESKDQQQLSLSKRRGWKLAWSWTASAPIIASPAVQIGALIAAAVSGEVAALSFTGRVLWRVDVGSEVFAPLRSVPGPVPAVLFGTKDGRLLLCSSADGRNLCVHNSAAAAPISTAAGVLSDRVTSSRNAAPSIPDREGLDSNNVSLVSCSNDGVVALLRLTRGSEADSGQAEVQAEFAMPLEVFSSPVVFGRWAIFGCRDDNLYCLDLNA